MALTPGQRETVELWIQAHLSVCPSCGVRRLGVTNELMALQPVEVEGGELRRSPGSLLVVAIRCLACGVVTLLDAGIIGAVAEEPRVDSGG